MRRWFIAVSILSACLGANAQVHRCIDAAGKATFSDTPCPSSAKSADRVLGSDATEKRLEPEDAGYRRNMESINRSRAAL